MARALIGSQTLAARDKGVNAACKMIRQHVSLMLNPLKAMRAGNVQDWRLSSNLENFPKRTTESNSAST